MNFRWFVKNPVKVIMFFMALVLMGYLSYQRLALNLFPDLRTPRITIVAGTIGLSPEEAEWRVTEEFERRLSSIKGVAKITSYSRERNIVIHVDFHWGQDMEFAYLDVKKSVGILETEENIDKIDVFRFDPNAAPLMTLAFTGEIDRIQTTSLIENSLRPKLETIEGVAYVNANGVSHSEVLVLVDEDVMGQHGLTAESLMQAINSNNFSSTGGVIREGNEEMVLKFISRFKNVEEIGRCVVTIKDNFPIHLSDIAQIAVGPSLDETLVRQDGQESISLDIFREPDANAVKTARRVREVLAGLNARGDFGLKVAVDRSLEVEAALTEVVDTAIIGMGLATLVLFLFLRNIFATLIVAVAIPISIIATFSLMYFQHLSLNIMTLGGLALGAGMLIDNAVVVAENIFRHRQMGVDSVRASADGTREVAMAITAATLTTIVVFLPLVYVHGIAGLLFKDQALTVVYSLLISLLVALILIPMLTARLGSARAVEPGAINRAYGSFLSLSLKIRWLMLVAFIGIMALSFRMLRTIPSEFFPEAVNGRMTMVVEMPQGTRLEETAMGVARLEQLLARMRYRDPELAPLLQSFESWQISGDDDRWMKEARLHLAALGARRGDDPWLRELFRAIPSEDEIGRQKEVETKKQLDRVAEILDPLIVIRSFSSTIGVDPESIQAADDRIFGPHTARMQIVLNPNVLRELRASHVIKMLRENAKTIPGMKSSFESKSEFLQNVLGKNRGDVAVEVHAEDFATLRRTADDVAAAFGSIPGIINVRTNLALGDDNFILEPDRRALVRNQFDITDLSTQIEAYLGGNPSDKLKLDQGEMVISIHNPRAERKGLEGLMNLTIVSKATNVGEKLKDLVQLRTERGTLEIMRINQEKTLLVMADLDDLNYQSATQSIQDRLDALAWLPGSSWNVSGEEVKRRESFDRLFFALVIAAILVYMVIASILESLIHPLTIMLSVPFALVGVVIAFIATGISLNIMGYIGVVMLIGIVVNDAIVLLDRIQQIEAEGHAIREAVILAGRQRLRPIMMTSLTTILALLPLALGFGNGAELRRPMAIAVIGGLASSTLLTLWILPGLYLCVEDLRGLIRRLLRFVRPAGRSASEEAAP